MVQSQRLPAKLSVLEWKRFEQIGSWLVLLGVFATVFGLSWDVQWHSDVGPDTFWTLPHLFVYSGAALTGGACLAVVLLCTVVARSAKQPDWIPILGGLFFAPVGFVVAGFGAFGFLSFGLFDQWWHVIFGFDVTLASPPHIGLILSDILSTVGCVLIFVRGRQVEGFRMVLATALSLAFTLPFMIATLFGLGFELPAIGMSALLLPLGLVFVVSSTRNPWAAFAMTLMLTGFRWLCMTVFPIITRAYADALGWSLRDGSSGVPEMPALIPVLAPVAGLVVSLILVAWKSKRWALIPGVVLAGLIAAPILYADSSLIPMKDSGWLTLIPLALVGMMGAWLGWQLGVVTRHANRELEGVKA
jgi:lipid-A-disaccharide synthase-like uncharacterized protein